MEWVDVCGPPGVGKSTLCDADWPPRVIPHSNDTPQEWASFIRCVDRLLSLIKKHRSIRACRSMINRSFRKMATVASLNDERIYIQTGFAQRGLGIGWRMTDLGINLDPLREYYQLMPKSLGVVCLYADIETIQARNVARNKDRSYMVPLMVESMDILAETVSPVLMIDTRDNIDNNKKLIADFASKQTANTLQA